MARITTPLCLAMLGTLVLAGVGQAAAPRRGAKETVGQAFYQDAPAPLPLSDRIPPPPPLSLPNEEPSDGRALASDVEPPRNLGGSCETPGSCNWCDDCVPDSIVYGRAEYLGWWTRSNRLPTLVTTGLNGIGQNGVLGATDTVVLVGGNRLLDTDARSGGRFTVGFWLDRCHSRAIESSFFVLEESSDGIDNQSSGTPLLARPFFNVQTGAQASQVIAAGGISTGGVFVSTYNDLLGGDVLVRRTLSDCCDRRVDFLYGYRYARLKEGLAIRDELTSINPASPIPLGTVIGGLDSFDTANRFHGGELGLDWVIRRDGWSVSFLSKVALGNMRQTASVGGFTTVAVPGVAPVTTVGGLLTQPSNIGSYERDVFAVIPEFGVTLRGNLTQRLEASFGYTFLYLSDVIRPADQVDLSVDPRQITNPAGAQPFPAFSFNGTDYWAQGISLGLEYRY